MTPNPPSPATLADELVRLWNSIVHYGDAADLEFDHQIVRNFDTILAALRSFDPIAAYQRGREDMRREAPEAVRAEREACAKIAEGCAEEHWRCLEYRAQDACSTVAAHIRSRATIAELFIIDEAVRAEFSSRIADAKKFGSEADYENLGAWCVRNADALCARAPSAIAKAVRAERDRCRLICDDWIRQFGAQEIKYVAAREYAVNTVEDIRDLIVSGSRATTAEQEKGK